ncbi:hypothetical protein M5K25_001683 [Dendrobium thyrsiflorum]|uniref:Uncharacterized protein n=1 Tax=Dendrobium thyrsiflorum TaxID=117978 RepID=A0ABD0W3D0_DENTH
MTQQLAEFVAVWAVRGSAGLETVVLDVQNVLVNKAVEGAGSNKMQLEAEITIDELRGRQQLKALMKKNKSEGLARVEVAAIANAAGSDQVFKLPILKGEEKWLPNTGAKVQDARTDLAAENVQVKGCQMQVGCSRFAAGMFLAELKICREVAWWKGGEGSHVKPSHKSLPNSLNLSFGTIHHAKTMISVKKRQVSVQAAYRLNDLMLEDGVKDIENKLASPPSVFQQLLLLLNKAEILLSIMEQYTSTSMLSVIQPAMKPLIAKDLLGHSDIDVKVSIASYLSEITRNNNTDASYDDDIMKEILGPIVRAFKNLDEMSSSFLKRVSIS